MELADDIADDGVATADPERLVWLAERRELVRSAIDELPDRARTALVLRYDLGLSYAEIADILGVPASFVGVILLRARRSLRRKLASEEAVP